MSRYASRTMAMPRRNQQGVSLLVVLVLLLVMSVLGIAVLRSSSMQERMSANLYDRSLAFQNAEAAMRHIQFDILGASAIKELQYGKTLTELRAIAGTNLTCATDGVCDQSSPIVANREAPVWLDASNTSDGKTMPYHYSIEYLGTGKGSTVLGLCETTEGKNSYQCQRPMFRVTVRGEGPGHAQVVLQTNVVSR